jgi:predicted MFS family arabinose efflux permease
MSYTSAHSEQPRAFEPWMISNIAAGAASLSFVILLIPPFIAQVTGSATRSGIVLAVIGLAALSGPYIGRLADRRGLHRSLYVASIFGLSIAFALLAVDDRLLRYSPLIGILLGVCLAAQGTLGPAFIVGAKLDPSVVARQLTAFSVSLPVGQVVGAVAIAIGLLFGLSGADQFVVASLVLAVLAIGTMLTINKPARRLATARSTTSASAGTGKHLPASKIYFSVFGLFMLVATLGAIANNGMTSQIANILPNVYGFSDTQTTGVVGIAGLLSVGAIILSGEWMRRTNALSVYAGGTVIKWIGMFSMALVGLLGGPHLLLAALVVQFAYVAPLLTRTGAPQLASVLAPVSAAQANGYYFATSALGAFIGSLLAGWSADTISYNAINWTNTILSGAALLLLIVALLPRAQAFFVNSNPLRKGTM